MKVLLTGGTGYIGSHTAIAMIDAGCDVVIADNLSNSRLQVIDRIQQITGARPEFYECDIRDRAALGSIFTEHSIDAAIHIAGLKGVGESTDQPLQYYRNNLDGTLTLLEMMAAHGMEIFNMGTGMPCSVLEVIAAFERNSGVKIPYEIGPRRAGDLPEFWADASKATRVLGWKPMRGLDEMCRDSWNWQRNGR